MHTRNHQRPPHSAKSQAASRLTQLLTSRRRALRWRLLFVGAVLAVTLLLTLLSKAHAAGGAYVVDDAAINSPGECNVDAWHKGSRHQGSQYQSVLSSACTFGALPGYQLGASFSREPGDGGAAQHLSPQLKTQLLSQPALGLAVALAASADVALDRRHAFDGASLTLPVTLQPVEALRLNVNLGRVYAYDQAEHSNHWSWGGGIEYAAADALSLLAERFGERHADSGWQAGPRLHLGPALDLDLLLGRQLNAERDSWLVAGFSLRF